MVGKMVIKSKIKKIFGASVFLVLSLALVIPSIAADVIVITGDDLEDLEIDPEDLPYTIWWEEETSDVPPWWWDVPIIEIFYLFFSDFEWQYIITSGEV